MTLTARPLSAAKARSAVAPEVVIAKPIQSPATRTFRRLISDIRPSVGGRLGKVHVWHGHLDSWGR